MSAAAKKAAKAAAKAEAEREAAAAAAAVTPPSPGVEKAAVQLPPNLVATLKVKGVTDEEIESINEHYLGVVAGIKAELLDTARDAAVSAVQKHCQEVEERMTARLDQMAAENAALRARLAGNPTSDTAGERAGVERRVAQLEQDRSEANVKVDGLETGLQFTQKSVEEDIPARLSAMEKVHAAETEALTIRQLDLDTWNRKWNLVVSGIDGTPNEHEAVTKAAVLTAIQSLGQGCEDIEVGDLSAAHRLDHADSGSDIVVRFLHLWDRDRVLRNCWRFKDIDGSEDVRITADIPPPIRPMRNELLKKRWEFVSAAKAEGRAVKTSVRYVQTYPYVQLWADGIIHATPSTTRAQLVHSVLHPAQRGPRLSAQERAQRRVQRADQRRVRRLANQTGD